MSVLIQWLFHEPQCPGPLSWWHRCLPSLQSCLLFGHLMCWLTMMMMMTTMIRWERASHKSSKDADRKSTEKGETAEWPKVIAGSPMKFCGGLGEAEKVWGPCILSKPKTEQHPNGHTFFCERAEFSPAVLTNKSQDGSLGHLHFFFQVVGWPFEIHESKKLTVALVTRHL